MNKYQEALDALEYLATQYENTKIGEQWEQIAIKIQIAKNMLQELVDKETPKKPSNFKLHNDGYIKFFYGNCPNCGTAVDDGFPSCLKCGQVLDWSEEHETD